MEERFVKASALLEEEAFLEQLKQAEDDAAVQKLFADNGVELSLEDIEKMVEESAVAAKSGELGEDDLENVSGGILVTLACFAIGGASIGFYASYGYRSLTRNKKKKK